MRTSCSRPAAPTQPGPTRKGHRRDPSRPRAWSQEKKASSWSFRLAPSRIRFSARSRMAPRRPDALQRRHCPTEYRPPEAPGRPTPSRPCRRGFRRRRLARRGRPRATARRTAAAVRRATGASCGKNSSRPANSGGTDGATQARQEARPRAGPTGSRSCRSGLRG